MGDIKEPVEILRRKVGPDFLTVQQPIPLGGITYYYSNSS
jgi:hypothetical protein